MLEKDQKIILPEVNPPSAYFLDCDFAFNKLGPTKIAKGKNVGIKKYYKYISSVVGLGVSTVKKMFVTYKDALFGEYCYLVLSQTAEKIIKLIISDIKANDELRHELIERGRKGVSYVEFLFHNQMILLNYASKYEKKETIRDVAYDLYKRLIAITDVIE